MKPEPAWMAETLRLAVVVMMVIMMMIKIIVQFFIDSSLSVIAQSMQWLAAGWTIRGSNPGWCEILHTRLDRRWGPPSLFYNGCRVFPGGKAAGAWRWPPTPSSGEFNTQYTKPSSSTLFTKLGSSEDPMVFFFFCNFSTVWCGRLIKLCFFGGFLKL